ncbi:MAG: hypothetical protein GW789_05260 [Ignavibacteria bacterium]|jgi:hypothetical protein|nr:hypothetical protein [Ignavibacteria bacterium]
MPKINLTNKPTSEQIRIINDYIARRKQHLEQGEISVEHLVNRFKHNRLINDKAKSAHFRKLLQIITTGETQFTPHHQRKTQ